MRVYTCALQPSRNVGVMNLDGADRSSRASEVRQTAELPESRAAPPVGPAAPKAASGSADPESLTTSYTQATDLALTLNLPDIPRPSLYLSHVATYAS